MPAIRLDDISPSRAMRSWLVAATHPGIHGKLAGNEGNRALNAVQ